MRAIIVQVILSILLIQTYCDSSALLSMTVKKKRAPLEIGFVTFTAEHSDHHHHIQHFQKSVTIADPHQENKTTILTLHKPHPHHTEVVHHHQVSVHSSGSEHVVVPAHTQHEWIPGRVNGDHAFIPAHEHHVFVPSHTLVLGHPATTVLLKPYSHGVDYSVYRQHYGGFGVGVDYGGAGAGHGFHVIF